MNPLKPELVVRGEQTAITKTPQVDAEEQTLVRRVHVATPAGPGSAMQVNEVGKIPTILEYTTNVGEHADALKTNCEGCAHWSNKAWRKYVEKCTGPASTIGDRLTIDTLRNRIRTTDGAWLLDAQGMVDVEATLMSFGICHVLSDWTKGIVGENPIHWPVAPGPDAKCPTAVSVPGGKMVLVTPAQPFGLFKPRDVDARKVGDKRRDALLFAATGKVR